MKRILVVDESRAVRETLALILGRDFIVIQRSHLAKESFMDWEEGVDLLILGASGGSRDQPSILLKISAAIPSPILFLVDSGPVVDPSQRPGKIDCLAKPFNPYELKERVQRLLARADAASASLQTPQHREGHDDLARYVEFPFVSAAASALAKRFALTSLPILILGEVGSGEERVARAVHFLNRRAGPWAAVYSRGITRENLLHQTALALQNEQGPARSVTLFVHGLESLNGAGQSVLLDLLEEEEGKGRSFWLLSTSRVDLLEKVYRGEFLAPLYYRLATLTLRLAPLRERSQDIAALATRLAQDYGKRLGQGIVGFSPEAVDRLCNYLWFGNLNELELVVARTLATHRTGTIEASNLVLGGREGDVPVGLAGAERIGSEPHGDEPVQTHQTRPEQKRIPVEPRSVNGNLAHSQVLINELAHELKNPMVTIKTFAQLLGDRFDDATFRVRFRETVASDIDRMDGLLETLLDFSRFAHPVNERIVLYEQLERALNEVLAERTKAGITIRWGSKGETETFFADKEQVQYVLKNILRTILEEIQPQGAIGIDIHPRGEVILSYLREGGRLNPLTQYLGLNPATTEDPALPLRILLARSLLERSGGRLAVNFSEGGKVLIRIALPFS